MRVISRPRAAMGWRIVVSGGSIRVPGGGDVVEASATPAARLRRCDGNQDSLRLAPPDAPPPAFA